MEEKKDLNEEKMEEVSGGRKLTAKEFSALDPAKKEEFLRTAKKLSLKNGEIPKELLNAVSGGDEAGDLVEVYEHCPNCGAFMYGFLPEGQISLQFPYMVCLKCGCRVNCYWW